MPQCRLRKSIAQQEDCNLCEVCQVAEQGAWCNYIAGICAFMNKPLLCAERSAVGCRSQRERNLGGMTR